MTWARRQYPPPQRRRWRGFEIVYKEPVIAVLRIVEFVNALERKEIGRMDHNPPWLRG
jgi:hypothetical protein